MSEINVHCVFGDSNASHIERVLVPSLVGDGTLKVNLRFLNYTPGSTRTIDVRENPRLSCRTLVSDTGSAKGFAENHNILFREFAPSRCFVLINPDCISTEGLLEVLMDRFNQDPEHIGLVEASQWPFQHPKEFDSKTGETPWASGACVLVNSKFYAENGGMDERFFLYAEDVDLSWASWLSGYKVIHEEKAKVVHFTNAPHESHQSWSAEYLYGLRNHVLLVEKYFGLEGRHRALSQVKAQADPDVYKWVDRQVTEQPVLVSSRFAEEEVRRTSQIRVYGKGLYHKMRKS
jgi:hypothetical protein